MYNVYVVARNVNIPIFDVSLAPVVPRIALILYVNVLQCFLISFFQEMLEKWSKAFDSMTLRIHTLYVLTHLFVANPCSKMFYKTLLPPCFEYCVKFNIVSIFMSTTTIFYEACLYCNYLCYSASCFLLSMVFVSTLSFLLVY